MNHKSHGSTTIIQVVCAIIFVLFSIHYIYSFQGDVLGMMQYSWSDHETHYNRIIGGSIIFAILLIITYLVALFCHFTPRLKAFVFFPAILIMAQMTAVNVDFAGNVTMPWYPAWITIILLLAYPFIVRWFNNNHTTSILPLDAENVMQWLCNFLIMIFMVVVAYCIGNTDRNLHTRLAVERLCHERQNVKALAEGIPQHDHGSAITMFRALALARQEKKDTIQMTLLGEHLFNYNIDGKEKTLLPRKGTEPHGLLFDSNQIWQTIGFVPRNVNEDPVVYLKRELRRHTAHPAARDYLLCTYLLRKDLNTFVRELPKYYDVKKSLPQHYVEALTMYYASLLSQREIHSTGSSEQSKDSVNIDNAFFEDYSDFQDLLHSRTNATVKNASLRDNYFGTYWYYYYLKD